MILNDILFGIYRKYDFVNHLIQKPVIRTIYQFYCQFFLFNKEFPKYLNLETTNKCNLRCKMCPTPMMDSSKQGNMDIAIAEKVVRESIKYGPGYFHLYKFGEPFFNSALSDYVTLIKETNPDNKIYITTNGTLIQENDLQMLVDFKVDDVNFSVDSLDPDEYRKIRGGKLDRVLSKIDRLIEIKNINNANYPRISVSMVELPETFHKKEKFISHWKKHGIRVVTQSFNTFGGGLELGEFVSSNEQAKNLPKFRYPCHSLWSFPSVNWDGTVSLCCVDWDHAEIIGDLNKESLHEVWAGEKIKKYREYHLNGEYHKIKLCKNCTAWAVSPSKFPPMSYKKVPFQWVG